MGSIHPYESAKGAKLYRIVYRRPDHKQTSERGFTTKREATIRLAEVEVSKDRGGYINPSDGNITISMLGADWLAAKKGVLKPSTYSTLETAWRIHVEPKWGIRRVTSIKHSEVQKWVSAFQKSATVVSRAYGILAGILDVAERDRRISVNPARGVTLPRKNSTKERRYLTHNELWGVAENAGKHEPLVLVLGYCGLRWGEAIGLRVSDIDFERKRISVTRNVVEVDKDFHEGTPKTHEARIVPVPDEVLAVLKSAVEGKSRGGIVFDNGHGGYMKRVRASKQSASWWKTALSSAGVDRMVLHDLRHTAASLAVSAGANVKAVQRMLGHASAAMTLDTYADLFDDDLEALATRLNQAIASRNVAKVLPDQGSQK